MQTGNRRLRRKELRSLLAGVKLVTHQVCQKQSASLALRPLRKTLSGNLWRFTKSALTGTHCLRAVAGKVLGILGSRLRFASSAARGNRRDKGELSEGCCSRRSPDLSRASSGLLWRE